MTAALLALWAVPIAAAAAAAWPTLADWMLGQPPEPHTPEAPLALGARGGPRWWTPDAPAWAIVPPDTEAVAPTASVEARDVIRPVVAVAA